MPQVTAGQLALLLLAAALFAAEAGLSLSRLWLESSAGAGSSPGPAGARRRAAEQRGLPGQPRQRDDAQRRPLRGAAKACLYFGLLANAVVLVWHAAERGSWLPLEDNFNALAWLGLLLALFVLYVQRTRPLRGLDWFVMPIVVLLLAAAAVFGRTKPHEYLGTAWSLVHRLTAYGGMAAFAVGCAGGTMFLIVSHRLKAKTSRPIAGPGAAPMLGSLERLERLMLASVTLGFALLTIGAVTGLMKVAESRGPAGAGLGPCWYLNPKVLLSAGAWLVYAIVLHSPINPSFRGRRAAVLSVVGFVLVVAILVAVQFMPAR